MDDKTATLYAKRERERTGKTYFTRIVIYIHSNLRYRQRDTNKREKEK